MTENEPIYGHNFQRRPFNFASYGMIKIEKFFDKDSINTNITYILKCLKDKYNNIESNNIEIRKYDKKKELKKLKSILGTCDKICKSLISGIEGNNGCNTCAFKVPRYARADQIPQVSGYRTIDENN